MSVYTGTRPGTKPTERYPGWDYMKSTGPGWDKLRDEQRLGRLFEDGINKLIATTEKALSALYIAQVMLHGGHVDRGALAKSGLRKDMQPAAVLVHIRRLLASEARVLLEDKK